MEVFYIQTIQTFSFTTDCELFREFMDPAYSGEKSSHSNWAVHQFLCCQTKNFLSASFSELDQCLIIEETCFVSIESFDDAANGDESSMRCSFLYALQAVMLQSYVPLSTWRILFLQGRLNSSIYAQFSSYLFSFLFFTVNQIIGLICNTINHISTLLRTAIHPQTWSKERRTKSRRANSPCEG